MLVGGGGVKGRVKAKGGEGVRGEVEMNPLDMNMLVGGCGWGAELER